MAPMMRRYYRFLLHFARWWAVAALALNGFFPTGTLADLVAGVEVNDRAWALLFVIVFMAFAVAIWKGASAMLGLMNSQGLRRPPSGSQHAPSCKASVKTLCSKLRSMPTSGSRTATWTVREHGGS
jgi:hypothetical protein